MQGHTRRVAGALLLEGGGVLSWSEDGTLRRWHADGRPDGPPLEGHTRRVAGALLLEGGGVLSWSKDRTLRRWSSDGRCESAIPLPGRLLSRPVRRGTEILVVVKVEKRPVSLRLRLERPA
jgi:hypothetical protein